MMPDHFDIVKNLMDLGIVMKKVESGDYRSFEEFKADIFLMFDKTLTYNSKYSWVYRKTAEFTEINCLKLHKIIQVSATTLNKLFSMILNYIIF